MRPVPVFAGSDEGYIAAFAQRLLDGRMLPYVDAISHRGPLLYWLAAAFVAWFGKGWLPMRMAALVMHLLTVALATELLPAAPPRRGGSLRQRGR